MGCGSGEPTTRLLVEQFNVTGVDISANKRMIEKAGLKILSAREETADEFGEPVMFLWIVAQKP